jgi:hypothetical protein
MSRTIANVVIGDSHTSHDAPSHVSGVHEGNAPGALEEQAGFVIDRDQVRGTARRSTGINPERRDPIDPRMPNLSPA